MKKLLVVATIVAVSFSSCGGGGGSIKNDADSFAYAIGVDLGHQIKMSDSTLNANLIAKGIIDVFKNRTQMTHDSARMVQQEYLSIKLPAKNLKEGIAYLESVEKDNKNVVKTESGLLYEVIMPGDESVRAINDGDKVKVKYVGRHKEGLVYNPNKEGAIFDQNEEVEFELNRVIRGWAEGIKLVGKGGKIKLWIPADLAYGEHGNRMYGGPIGPNEPIQFEVEVIDVIPADVEVPAEGAEEVVE